ncbi:MAG: cation diffusion facilitator family transporter [Rikenellaceae bacterium]|jgi:cation diffusion facilitator family transporter|nr:cation diffusion facilitator family transporter [Rikenellaceae bacterium]
MAENDNKSRQRAIVRASWVSVAGNAVLSTAKITVGLLAGSLAVLGDGIDSATDVIISFVTLYTARIASRPPNPKYAYGYERADSIATKLLSFIIFVAGAQMLITSARSIFAGAERELPGQLAIWVTVFSMAGKMLLSWYQFAQGRKAGSSMLIANAKNLRNDVLISAGVLVGLLFTFVLKMPILDAVTSLIISLFIIKTAVDIFRETSIVLMDGMEDQEVYRKIFEAVEKVPEATNPHRVRSRQIGKMYMIELDVEVDGKLSLTEAHRISQRVERSIRKTVDNVYDIVIHVEPRGVRHEHEEFGVDRSMLGDPKEE